MDLEELRRTIERLRTEAALAGEELRQRIAEARRAKELAIESREFQTAALMRDQERELVRQQRAGADAVAWPNVLQEIRRHLGLDAGAPARSRRTVTMTIERVGMTSIRTTSQFTIPGSDGLELVAYRWDPSGSPRGVVQVTHGMGDHATRFDGVAQALADAGFAVVAVDQRGSGATAKSEAELGILGPGGWNRLVADVGAVLDWNRQEFSGLPLVLFAHSMGSFAAQQFLLDHSDKVDAVVLTGTAAIDLLEPALNLDEPIDLAMFNAPFQPARTDFDWLTRDESIVDAYINDPWCGFGLDIESGKEMFVAARRVADPSALSQVRSDLPVHIVVGESDPVNGGMQLVHALLERLTTAGITNVTMVSYPEGRHEILNETNRNEVIGEIVTWVQETVAG